MRAQKERSTTELRIVRILSLVDLSVLRCLLNFFSYKLKIMAMMTAKDVKTWLVEHDFEEYASKFHGK